MGGVKYFIILTIPCSKDPLLCITLDVCSLCMFMCEGGIKKYTCLYFLHLILVLNKPKKIHTLFCVECLKVFDV